MHGNGRIKFLRDGVEYKGTFKNDQIEGYGVFKWRNGARYEGPVKAGKMNGMGRYTYANGKEYKGYFNRGEKGSEKMRKYEIWKANGYGAGSQNPNIAEENGEEDVNGQENIEQPNCQPSSNNN